MQRNSAIRGEPYSRAASPFAAPRRRATLFPRCCAAALALAWVLPAAGAKIAPFADSAALGQVTGDEQRVWSQGDEVAQEIARGGVIYENAANTAYVQLSWTGCSRNSRATFRSRS